MATKLLVVGGVHGHFSAVFSKIAAQDPNNNTFSSAIVAGDLFADPASSSTADDEQLFALLDNKIKVPLPTYFTLGQVPLPQRVIERLLSSPSDEICENLYFFGKRTTLTTTERVKIVALGGRSDPNIASGTSKDAYTPVFSPADAKVLHGANTAHILVTPTWPKWIRHGSKIDLPQDAIEPVGDESIAELCSTLRPRYHFSSSPNFFYEREPFLHAPKDPQTDEKHITRFISIPSYSPKAKRKWLYAFRIDPTSEPSTDPPPSTTASPFPSKKSHKRQLPGQEQQAPHASGPERDNRGRPRKRHQRQPPPGPGECFFCLSNPNIATHLITSIGDDSYVTTARGPLTTATTFASLPFPGHLLIIPLTHSPTLHSITDPQARSSTYAEMTRFRRAMHRMLHQRAPHQLGAVTWEISRANGVHTHWQFLPIDADLVHRGLVSAAFKVQAENEQYAKMETREVNLAAAAEIDDGDRHDFFRVWIWSPPKDTTNGAAAAAAAAAVTDADGPTEGLVPTVDATKEARDTSSDRLGREQCLFLPLSEDVRFDLQFGRRVLAKLLGLENRINWKDVSQSQEAETADAEAFKAAFKEFDFSAQ
ncbi:MAG: hypothetical protein M1825_001634 [Sarcosagium campestre]|nr:MAG: hypothetical protein M1825_001634 [Sarcosagium campestre]